MSEEVRWERIDPPYYESYSLHAWVNGKRSIAAVYVDVPFSEPTYDDPELETKRLERARIRYAPCTVLASQMPECYSIGPVFDTLEEAQAFALDWVERWTNGENT